MDTEMSVAENLTLKAIAAYNGNLHNGMTTAIEAVVSLVLEEAAAVCQQLGRVHRERGNIPGTWSFAGCEDCAAVIRALTQEGRDGQPRRTLDEMRGMFEDAYKHNRTERDD